MVEVEILGETYRFSTSYDKNHMEELASRLDEKITTIKRQSRSRSMKQVLILVAMDLLDETLRLREEEKRNLDLTLKDLERIRDVAGRIVKQSGEEAS